MKSRRVSQAKNHLPQLLKAAPQLLSLTLHAQPWEFLDREERQSIEFRQPLDGLASESLTTLTLVDFVYLLVNCRFPVGWLKPFEHLQVLRITLHSDLFTICKSCPEARVICLAFYFARLRDLIQDCDFKTESSDSSEAAKFPLPIEVFVWFSDAAFDLFHSIGWSPVLDWTSTYLLHPNGWPPSLDWTSTYLLRSSGSTETSNNWSVRTLDKYTNLFDALERHGIPIKITLRSGQSRSFFPDPAELKSRHIESYPNPNISEWLLEELGARFDELSIIWDPEFVYSDAYPSYASSKSEPVDVQDDSDSFGDWNVNSMGPLNYSAL